MFDSRAAAPHSGKAEREGGPDVRSHPPRLREKYCNSPFMASSVYNVVACFLKTNNLTFPDRRNTYHSATKDKGWCWVGIYPPNVGCSSRSIDRSVDRRLQFSEANLHNKRSFVAPAGLQLFVPYATESVIQASVSAGLSCDRFLGTSVKLFAP